VSIDRSQTVIVTGASSGIGAAIVSRLRRSGRRVFATMRQPDKEKSGPDTVAMDVTSDDSIAAAVAEVLASTGRIDAIVNNAGISKFGAVEEATSDEALSVFQTNFFGVHRLIRAVLPTMRSQRTGRIVTIGSIAGFLPEPFESFYSASKHALEGYIESLAYEVEPFGIRTTLVQPGYIRTSLGTNTSAVAANIDVYAKRRSHVAESSKRNIGKGTDPDAVAQAVEKAIASRNPPLKVRVGTDAHLLYVIRHVLPPSFFSVGVRRRTG
jgi:NAD(P)-dependent dehydrogenase (short-subunit alcohol dehydrogenase family)